MDLNYIRKLNGTYGKTTKQAVLNEMLSQYEEANESVITEFDVLINSSKGKNVFINDTPSRVLIEYKNNKNSKENDFMVEVKSYMNSLTTGDYVRHYDVDLRESNTYIIPSKPEKRRGYELSYGLFCNQVLRKSDWIVDDVYVSIPCNISNDSYGSKTNLNNDFIAETDTKTKIVAQHNEYTKLIKKDDRFIFANSENDIFKVIDISTSINNGIIVLICKKDLLKPEYDDLDNNIAWNGATDIVEPTDYIISGADEIKVNNSYTYTLSPSVGSPMWRLDGFSIDNGLAEINVIDDFTVSVVGKVAGEFIELVCEIGDIIVSKEIMIVR